MLLSKRYELPYHPTSFNEWKTVVILGIAVAILKNNVSEVERKQMINRS